MAKTKLYNSSGIVYSTAADFKLEREEESWEQRPPGEQLLLVVLDKKHRGGKVVSIIKGFSGNEHETELLAKQLKSFCGSGGSVKNDEIIIQGDHRVKILQWLFKKGYSKAKKV